MARFMDLPFDVGRSFFWHRENKRYEGFILEHESASMTGHFISSTLCESTTAMGNPSFTCVTMDTFDILWFISPSTIDTQRIYIWLNYRLIWNSRNVRLFGDDSPFTILILPVTSQCEVMIKFEAVIISLHYPFYNPYCRWLHPMIFQFITVKITINHHKII